MGFTIPSTGDAFKKNPQDHDYARESAHDPFALPSDQMETDLDVIDDDDLLNGMLEEDDMEVTLNPVPPPPPLPPIPFRKSSKTPTTMTTAHDAAATTEKPDAAADMMETFEKRLKAMQDQMAERERQHAQQIEDLSRQLATASRSETHPSRTTPRNPQSRKT